MDFSDFYFVMLVNMYKDSFVRLNLLIIYMCTLSGENGPGPFSGFFRFLCFILSGKIQQYNWSWEMVIFTLFDFSENSSQLL